MARAAGPQRKADPLSDSLREMDDLPRRRRHNRLVVSPVSSMSEAKACDAFRKTVCLRNGSAVLIRTARPDDRDRLITAFQALDRQSIYTRYFSFRKSLSQTELDRLDAQDPDRCILLVSTLEGPTGETVIAGASCIVTDADGPVRRAECAFTVEEDYQGQGLAGHLLTAIVELARRQGIGRLEADVLAGNPAMLAVFKRSGLPMTQSRHAGVVHLVLDLAPEPARRLP